MAHGNTILNPASNTLLPAIAMLQVLAIHDGVGAAKLQVSCGTATSGQPVVLTIDIFAILPPARDGFERI